MVFMFISVAYMHYVRIEKERIKEVAVAYENAQLQLYNALDIEFAKDLQDWDAEIDKQTLEVRFKSPDVLFGLGSTELKPKFKLILDDFFPRYLKVLDNYQEHITEVRIEGHTSTDWTGTTNPDIAYFNNMALSQGRTRAVLQYVYGIKISWHTNSGLKTNLPQWVIHQHIRFLIRPARRILTALVVSPSKL